jgi:proline iminopeptidase
MDQRGDMIAGYHHLLFSGDHLSEAQAARVWSGWENALASVHSDLTMGDSPSEYARAFARLENHYFTNAGFLEHDDWIMTNRHRILHIPASIVQGRLDMICPPISAHRLALGWTGAQLSVVPMAGHALSEYGISEKLVQIMDRLGKDDTTT